MKNSLFVLALSVLFMSCYPTYYVPTTHNTPLIQKKGEAILELNGSVGFESEIKGHVHYARGISDKFSIMVNGNFYRERYEENKGYGYLIEGGVGYYKPIFDDFVFELYSIYGIGYMKNVFSGGKNNQLSAIISRFGIQPNFGFKGDYFELAFSARLVNLSYYNIKGDLSFYREGKVVNEREYLENHSNNFLIEPAITYKFGPPELKILIQYGYSHNISYSSFNQERFLLAFGLSYNF